MPGPTSERSVPARTECSGRTHISWRRGANEGTSGISREILPKGIDLSPFADQDLRRLEYVMNNTPRKILDAAMPPEASDQIKLDRIAGVALQA